MQHGFNPYRIFQSIVLMAAALSAASCAIHQKSLPADARQTAIFAVNLSDLSSSQVTEPAVVISSAKNESIGFALQLDHLPAASRSQACTLRLGTMNLQTAKATLGAESFSAYQVLSLPVDVNRAGFVRHTGLSAAKRQLPRALLPMKINAGEVNLSAVRAPDDPTNANGNAAGKPLLLWIDLHVPPETPAGDYEGRIDVLLTGFDAPIASLPVRLTLYNFVLPDERHLNLVGQVGWESLVRLYPNQFEALTPRLMNRNDDRYKAAVHTLDELVQLAEANRVQLVIPRLQPSVKWPGGRPPTVSWSDFDALVGPWLRGEQFADKVPLGFWPLPACDGLSNYDPKSRREYWADAANHFDQNDWLPRCPVTLEKTSPGRASAIEAFKLSVDAAGVLGANSRLRVVLPVEDDQVQVASSDNPNLIQPGDTSRLLTSNPNIVFSSPVQNWPAGLTRPQRWLRADADVRGLIPYVGAGGDERDVRLWAWLSFLPLPPPQLGVQYGPVQFIRFADVLPRDSNPTTAADPNELIWCYPGSWFGVNEPVASIQLKWLRRAQQDFEYLYLARQRGDVLSALYMSRLMTKPVEIQPDQQPDPTFGLMCGTADPQAWDQAIRLIAQRILLRQPGQSDDPETTKDLKDRQQKLNIETLQWSYPQERPVLAGRSTQWSWEPRGGGNNWINLQLGIDIYNASDSTPTANSLAWKNAPDNAGWQVRPQPVEIPSLATYHVLRVKIDGSIDPVKIGRPNRQPVELTFTNGYNKNTSSLRMELPIATSVRREGLLNISDASLDDWTEDDAIQDGPMIRMMSRPALQAQRIEPASTPSHIYTTWADENFYLAFHLGGIRTAPVQTVRNFVDYQFRRAWGEDLCQLIVQAVYADNTAGPILHVALKPSGADWEERKLDPRTHADPWQPLLGAGVRYADRVEGSDWRGELAIPWKAINDDRRELPVMLRFNFSQHRQQAGESASWAGPVDFGRDDAFTGLIVLKESDTPGTRR